jgi:hypothetical protein
MNLSEKTSRMVESRVKVDLGELNVPVHHAKDL